jgi:hypothetical protein
MANGNGTNINRSNGVQSERLARKVEEARRAREAREAREREEREEREAREEREERDRDERHRLRRPSSNGRTNGALSLSAPAVRVPDVDVQVAAPEVTIENAVDVPPTVINVNVPEPREVMSFKQDLFAKSLVWSQGVIVGMALWALVGPAVVRAVM